MRKKWVLSRKKRNIAVFCANGLGDGLLSMVIAHNLYLNGHFVTIYSNILYHMKDCFSNVRIKPFVSEESLGEELSAYDFIIAFDHSMVSRSCKRGEETFILLESSYDKKKSMLENILSVCKENLSLPSPTRDNGMRIPGDALYRCFSKRVLIHPFSSSEKKNWPLEKFVKLAKSLRKEDFRPIFLASPEERNSRECIFIEEKGLDLISFSDFPSLIKYVYESGYMIGNDSGPGHLASFLRIPTLSIFARKSYSHLWRPGWGIGETVSPVIPLLGSSLRQKYWKNFLLASKVLKSFKSLVKKFQRFR